MRITAAGSRGTLNGLPVAVAIERMKASAETLRVAVEKAPGRNESFGEILAQAVKDKVSHQQPRFRADASPEANEGGFGDTLKKAVEQCSSGTMPTQKQHKERVARERVRYHHKPRPRTKSE